MRRMAALVAILAALATPARAAERPGERLDAQMLLDLDLLTEADPTRHRDQSLAERMRLLEVLRMLESPAGAAPARGSSTPAARPPATSTAPAEGGAK
jgi:hypothetical protein